MATRIQLRRDTKANWTSANPTPLDGEFCYEKDTGYYKIGNGTQAYNDLKYGGDSDSVQYYEWSSAGVFDVTKKSMIVRFDGTGDITQVLPDITKVQEGTRIYVENQKVDGEITLQAFTGQKVVGESSWPLGDGEYAELIADKNSNSWQLGMNSFVIKDPSSKVGGITLDDGTNNIASVKKINLKGLKVDPSPEGESYTPTEVQLTGGINLNNMHDDYKLINDVFDLGFLWPLKVQESKTGPTQIDPNRAVLTMDHASFEPIHKPSFLAYLADDEEVVGKLPQGGELDAGSHHDGALWFDNIVWPSGTYISIDKTNKTYGIQEADQLDPNVSGGTDYLIAFRAHMKGKAPSDGFVRIYLYNKSIDPFEPTGYLLDVNDEPLSVQRNYKSGEELGYLDVIGVVNAKGLQSFSCHVVDTFQNDVLELTDRTEGATGLMIQALTSTAKTGDGLQQFELDTNQNIEFSSHYLGADRMNLGWAILRDEPVISYTAGTDWTTVMGLELINRNGLKLGTVNRELIIQDDGVHTIDFNFGKVFSAEETVMLRGKEVTVYLTHTNQNCAFRVGIAKWSGKPDEYTTGIISSWNNTTPTTETDWEIVSNNEIVEDAVAIDKTTTFDFTVPSDANNYAIIIYPNDGPINPFTLKLSQFEVDVKTPFIGYVIHAPELANELHLVYDDEYKEFIQDNQGFASLRYTINNTELPAPCGKPNKGVADVDLNTEYNKISGSGARGGEGVLEFKADGEAKVATQLRLWNEQVSASNTTFWWATVGGTLQSPTYTKIDDSERTFTVPAGAKGVIFSMPEFSLQVEADDKIALRMTTDSIDGAFLQSTSPSKPMVKTEVKFKKLAVVQGSDDPNAILDPVRAARTTAGDTIYDAVLRGSKEFPSASSANITFTNLPTGSIPRCVGAFKKIPSGGIQSTTRVEQKFENNILTVSFGETAETIVLYEIWS